MKLFDILAGHPTLLPRALVATLIWLYKIGLAPKWALVTNRV
jgi:hypothetical protein